jgi:hypothetical protein
MTSQMLTSNQFDRQYPLFTDVTFTIGCPKQIDDHECGICTLDVAGQQTLTHTNGLCRITYCFDCWEKHFERSIQCPNCRRELVFDQTVEADTLVGRTREIHEQPWLTRKRHRAKGYDWLRHRYRMYNIRPAFSFINLLEEIYAILQNTTYLPTRTLEELTLWQEPWTPEMVQRASFFLGLIWAHQALGQLLDFNRLHAYPDIEQTIFGTTATGTSLWSQLASEITDATEI